MPIKRSKADAFVLPRENYLVFRDLLREVLTVDGSFKAQYLLDSFESKLLDTELSDSPEARRAAAVSKWLTCEVRNRDTNVRLLLTDETDFLFLNDRGYPIAAEDVLNKAREFITRLLGDTIPWERLKGSFSGGASTAVRRGVGTIARKYQEGTDITEDAIRHFLRLTKSDVWAPRDFTLSRGNVMFTVPKTSVIDRCAAKEPEYNMYVQKAVGDYIRQRLKRVGIDLNDQSINQRLAYQGSIDRSLATIDLSSASDSVTTQLVLRVLPEEWYYLLDDIRSKETCIDGEWHLNEMFSSMGNGFTFELESMIFWSILRSCSYFTRTSGRISVYGDDLICPTGLCESLLPTLDFLGFKVNSKKTFIEGPFRESCGKHWFMGEDVTPFYIKNVPKDVSDWILICNSFRRWSGFNETGIADPRYYELWQLIAEFVAPPLWGGFDLSSRSTLCAPGRYPIAELVRKHVRNSSEESRLSFGCYLHWLAASEDRLQITELQTSVFTTETDLQLRRTKRRQAREIPLFPQEFGIM